MKTEILFPEVANLCGDLMNVTYLRQSCPEMEVVETGLKDRPAFLDGGVDLVYVGSATERGLQLMVQALTPYKAELERYVDGGGLMLATGNALDALGQAQIRLDLLLRHEAAIRDADFLLFCTGWDQYWGTDAYYEGFPCLTEEGARFVAGLPLKGVGEDSISLDPCDTVDYPNHLTLFGAGLVNTENLKGLAQLIGREFTFLTMPLKFENADGCSCRAAAIVTKEA